MPATLIDSQVKPQFFSLTWFPEAKILLVRGQLNGQLWIEHQSEVKPWSKPDA